MDINQAIESAVRCQQEGKFQEAMDIWNQIIDIHPENPVALHSLGLLHYQTGNYDSAIEYIEKALRFNPSDDNAYNNLGIVYRSKHYLDKAVTAYKKAIYLNPLNINAHVNLGIIFHEKGLLDDAIRCYDNALKIDSNNDKALYYSGCIFQERGQISEAVSCYEKALQLNPNLVAAYINLGFVFFEQRDRIKEAELCFKKALEINPDSADAYNGLGAIFSDSGRIDKAVAYFQKAVQINPELTEAYNNLGTAYREKGQIDEAISSFQKALSIDPDNPWTYTNLAFAFQCKGLFDEAKTCQKKSVHFNRFLKSTQKQFENSIRDKGQLTNSINSVNKSCQKKILIAVPVFNRKRITCLALSQLNRYKSSSCFLQVYNDHSTEYDNSFLEPYADKVIQLPEKMRIGKLRMHQLMKFLESDYELLYITDNDMLHDPRYVSVLEELYEAGNCSLPVCLYNSYFHMKPYNILYAKNEILIKKTGTFQSMLLNKQMVQRIVDKSEEKGGEPPTLGFDFKVVAYLGLPWIVPEISYAEHFGAAGINNSNYDRDRAINPTPYLQERRETILKYLKQEDELQICL